MNMKKPGKTSKPSNPAPSQKAASAPARTQAETFAEAMRLFWSSQYDRAIPLFEQAAKGRDLSIAESAQMHIRMCRRRMEGAQPDLKTPEQQHLYALSLINEHRFEDALPWLKKAVAADPRGDYQYALALALGRLGRTADAADALRRALAADGSLRNTAKNDPDFAPLLGDAAIREVLEPSQPAS
ncbi:MAG: TPR end-of-group domain-containing protein [Acidobacteriota bacterium]